jgi:hypothetical protein
MHENISVLCIFTIMIKRPLHYYLGEGAVLVMIVWQLNLLLPIHSVSIFTEVSWKQKNPQTWAWFKLYTFVVHYLQMCMKEYGCCLKFRRGDNSTYTFIQMCVKFHKNPIGGLGRVVLTRYMDGRTDGQTDRVIPIYPPNFVCGGYKCAWRNMVAV